MKNSLRTQIILPKQLRQEIEQARNQSGESMAEFLRVAAEERLRRQQKRKEDLAKLADEVVGAVKRPSLTTREVIRWQRAMRRDQR